MVDREHSARRGRPRSEAVRSAVLTAAA
ncbi:TetR family transcriptional regulator, partial [Mycobacterium sp. ITM-2017-0098]